MVSALTALLNSVGGSTKSFFESLKKSIGRDELGSEVEDMVASLRECKDARDSLRGILSFVEDTVETLQEMALPPTLAYGMQRLPDDILREVFEAGFELLAMDKTVSQHSHHPASHYPVHLTRVCRRFRLVVLSTPRLWTKLGNYMPPNQLKAYLRRSKAADLTLTLSLLPMSREESERDFLQSLCSSGRAGPPPCNIADFLAITTAHCHRWSRFEYATSRDTYDEPQYCYTHPEFFKYQNIHLPRLTSLYWLWDRYYPVEGDDHTLPFKHWNMPNLTSFEGKNVLIDAQSVGPGLECCDLRFECDDGHLLDYCDTLRALENATNLRSLVFEVAAFCSADQFPTRTILRQLNYFNIRLECTTTDPSMLTLLGTLELPSLSHISLTFWDYEGCVADPSPFGAVVDVVTRCPMLEKFTFIFEDESIPYEVDILGTLAVKLPLLKEVRIRGVPLCHSPPNEYCSPAVSWRLLRLERCAHYERVQPLVSRVTDKEFQLHISEPTKGLRDMLGEKLHIHPFEIKSIPGDVVA